MIDKGYRTMRQFQCDYCEGAHERILKRMMETNMEQPVGYGEDPYCMEAAKLIKEACDAQQADVHFLVGGTQTNLTVIASVLRPYQGVLCANEGHINVHETGAIEACGHKVLTLPSKDGKISAEQIRTYHKNHMEDGSFEHIVQPGMVYISHPTELGTLYTLQELEEISKACRELEMPLFLDGARLGYGLMAKGTDVTLPDLARLCDVFYIGGTKVGALFGEALVITKESLKKDFRYMIKQKGGMLAKGRLLGIQFLTLFEDGLYMELGKHADKLADQIRETLDSVKIPYLVENTTNQIFPVFKDEDLKKFDKNFKYSYQQRVDETHSAVRFCTSWATSSEAVDELCAAIREICG